MTVRLSLFGATSACLFFHAVPGPPGQCPWGSSPKLSLSVEPHPAELQLIPGIDQGPLVILTTKME